MDIEDDSLIFSKTTLHPSTLWELYNFWNKEYAIRYVAVEDVHAIHGSSAKATFQFGANVERMLVIPAIFNLNVIRMQPKIWQNAIGLTVPKGMTGRERKKYIKTTVAEIVSKEFPQAPIYGSRGGLHDGNTDALGIGMAVKKIFNVFKGEVHE